MTVINANGNTYSDDGSTPKDMNDGGSADYFFPMVQDVMVEIDQALTTTSASEAAAVNAAINAVNAPGTNATSSNVVILGTGSKTCTIQTGKAFVVGSFVVWADTTAPSVRWMFGQITAHNPGTGSLTCNITRIQGSGPVSTWTISLSAPGSRDTGGAQTTAGNISVVTASLKYQQSTGYGNLRVAVQGGNSSDIPGPSAFAFRNSGTTYATDMLVNDGAGSGSPFYGFLPPGRTARIDASGTGFRSSDLLSYGSDIKTQITFSSTVAGTGGLWTKAVGLPSGATAVFVYGASLHVVVFDANGNPSTPLLIRSGLSTAGGEATVMVTPVNDDTNSDNVLVASCPDNGTALQTVIVTISGLTMALGTMVPTTLGTAAVRLVDLRPVINSIVNNRTFVLTALGSTTTLQHYGIVIVSSASTMTVGAVRTDTTTASFGAVVVMPNTVSDVYISLSSTATVLSAKAVTVNPTTGAQTLGSTATTTVTSASGILVRENLGSLTEALVVFLNTLPKISKLTISGTVPAFSAPAALTSSITTANTYGLSAWFPGLFGTAVSGTDSAGRFITEMMDWDPSTVTVLRTAVVSMSAAHTVVWIGVNAYPVNIWQLLSASELVVANSQTAEGFPTVQRLSGLATFAQALAAPEANYPRYARARTTMFGVHDVMAVTDGTKPSVDYTLDIVSGRPTVGPVNLFNSLSFSHLNTDDGANGGAGPGLGLGYSWLAAGTVPAQTLTLQRARIV